MKIRVPALAVLLFTSNVFATSYLTLNDMKDTVIDDNINIALAYENYIEAKETASVRTLDLLPSVNVDVFLYDYEYTILRSVIPEPYKYFDAKAAKEMAKAASVNRRVVQKNMILDLEKTFYIMNLNKELLVSFEKEKAIKDEIKNRSYESYVLGDMSFSRYNNYHRSSIVAGTNTLVTKEVIDTQELALKLILRVDDLTEAISLEKPRFDNIYFDYPESVEVAADLAVERSFEVKQFDYLLEAAEYREDSEAISWLSWSGIGFDYPARVRVAKSNVRQVELEKKKTIIEIRNQVASLYTLINRIEQKVESYKQLKEIADENLENVNLDYDNLLVDFIEVKDAEIDSLVLERKLTSLKYEKEILLIRLKRVLGINMLDLPTVPASLANL
ncbi:TolC family protein [Halobacteriovorax sp.]|uniref:TolC family protein n=1 Tax=Halobacteriovorax sp. TaxID=2020862 RepID=UPI0035616B73